MRYLRSFIFSLIMFPTALILSATCLLTTYMPYKKRYPVLSAWPRLTVFLAKWICGIKYEIIGKENIPQHGGIIVSNHQSTWETLAYFKIFPYTTFALKKELAQIPIFGGAIRLLEPILVDRDNARKALDQLITQGIDRLQKERLVTIYPEGRRMPVGELGEFKPGAAFLAVKAQKPVVPVVLDSGKYWPRRAFLKNPGTIKVIIGQPIEPGDLSASQLNKEILAQIQELYKKL